MHKHIFLVYPEYIEFNEYLFWKAEFFTHQKILRKDDHLVKFDLVHHCVSILLENLYSVSHWTIEHLPSTGFK